MPVPLFDGVILTAEVALAGSGGPYLIFGSGRFGVDQFAPTPVWSEVSTDVRSVETSRAFSREVQSWDPGTARIVLGNRHRYYSPGNLNEDSPYVVAGSYTDAYSNTYYDSYTSYRSYTGYSGGAVSQIEPLQEVRLRATYKGVEYPLYYGYVQDWLETYVPAHADAWVTLPCEDVMSRLAAVDGEERATEGAGEFSGRRIHRLLDAAGYTGLRNVELGQVTMQATNLSSNAATELKLTADSEGGALFVDADGSIVFERQYALIENSRSNTIQATFGDGSGTELPCTEMVPSTSGDMVKNVASFARVGGTAQLAEDSASLTKFGIRRETRTDLICETDAQALGLAQFTVARFKKPEYRIKQITVCPRDDPARLYPVVLGLRPRDMVRVIARPTDDVTITSDCHIAGIHHTISGGNWLTTFDLSAATIYTQYSTSRFGIGRFGSMRFFFGTGG